MPREDSLTVPQLARKLGISRVAAWNKVRKGQIPATKIGGIYLITDEATADILGKTVTKDRKKSIDTAIRRTVREYGDVLKKLGRE